jgi:hypothetical protein
MLPGLVSRHHLWDQDDVSVMAGDAVGVTQSGQQTYGLGRFFSSLYGQKVPGLGLLSVSLLRVKRRPSSPVRMEQLPPPHPETPQEVAKPKSQGKRGRPPGRKKPPRRDVVLRPYRRLVHETLTRFLEWIGTPFQVIDVVFDGALGHHAALQRVRHVGGHLLAKLRDEAALSCAYEGPEAGRGKRQKYGAPLAYHHMEAQHLPAAFVEKDIATKIEQLALWPKKLAAILHVVVMVQTHLTTQAVAPVVLCRSDWEPSYDHLMDY